MMGEYTPTTEAERQVRYYVSMQPMGPAMYNPAREATLDRMIAAIRAEAWDEGNRAHPKFGINPYRSEKQ